MSFENLFLGKNVLITGAGQGIGRVLVERLVKYKANVFILECNENLVEKVRQDFPNVRAEVCDISKWDETQKLIKSFGPMDHLVNNAANFMQQSVFDVTEQSLTVQLDVCIKGVYCVTQAVAKGMVEKPNSGRSIVSIASVAGYVALDMASVYSIAKSGVIMFTKSMAMELGKMGIRVNCVSPTGVNTDLFRDVALATPAAELMSRQPLPGRKILEPNEVAEIILFLLSPLSSMTNGHNYIVDGGISAC